MTRVLIFDILFLVNLVLLFDILFLVNSVKSYPNVLLCSHPLLFNLVHSTVLGLFDIILQ